MTDEELAILNGVSTNNLANQALQRKVSIGQKRIAPLIATPEADEAANESRRAMFDKNAPAIVVELDEDDIEALAEMALEGKTLAIISSVFGRNMPQTRLALMDRRVQARIDEMTAEMVRASSRKIKTSALRAVEKLIGVMENSESDKVVLSAAKELLRMAGVGEDGTEKEQAKTNDMQAKSTERLLEILQNVVGG